MRNKLALCSVALAAAGLMLLARPSGVIARSADPARGVTVAADEPHPEIRDAIGALERARDHLQHARHDFGGHRVEAIRAINEALRQLHMALEFDRDEDHHDQH
jgi:hypothetical protein